LIEVKFRLIDPREMHAKASAYARRFAQDDLADWDLDDGSDIRSDMKSTTDVRTRLDSPIHSMFPPSYYSGVTRGVSGNEATVEGVVRMGPDRVVRWHFVSISHL
jgi:hypothetical protein